MADSLQQLWSLYKKELEEKEKCVLVAVETLDSDVEDIPIIKVRNPIKRQPLPEATTPSS